MGAWYESLESQLKWEHYCELMKIVQPSAEDWRNLTVVPSEPPTAKPIASNN